jgi:hypothetical protein
MTEIKKCNIAKRRSKNFKFLAIKILFLVLDLFRPVMFQNLTLNVQIWSERVMTVLWVIGNLGHMAKVPVKSRLMEYQYQWTGKPSKYKDTVWVVLLSTFIYITEPKYLIPDANAEMDGLYRYG